MNHPDLLELTDPDSVIARQALKLYESAFPPAERTPLDGIKASIRQRGQVDPAGGYIPHFFAAVREDRALGISFYGYYREMRLGFLYYLAVDPEQRGQGLGGWLLQMTLANLRSDATRSNGLPPRGLIWEVERPVDAETSAEREFRQRRINFYQRNGALLLDRIDFLAPPLGSGLPPVMYHVMFMPSPGFNEDLSSRPFLTDTLDTILLHGYGVERDSEFYIDAIKKVMGNE
jgi:GNAT superfamily N-acetyltransferase